MLRGEELEEDLDEKSAFELSAADNRPKDVAYNPSVPIETFDFIVTDECHRSIYGLWRQVLEYFDAYLIGLTATPSKQTIGFFNQNLVMEYNHERAVADQVNVGYDVYRIKTQVTEAGGRVEKGYYVDKRSKESRKVRWERLDEDLTYAAKDLDRSVVVKSQIRTVIEAYKEALTTDLFPGRAMVRRRWSSARTSRTPRTPCTSSAKCSARATTSPRRSRTSPTTPRRRSTRSRSRSSRSSAPRPNSASPSPWT